MKTLIIFLLLASTAIAGPCDDARRDFKRAQKFGATDFKCSSRYDGTATSSWNMTPEGFRQYRDSETLRKMRKKPAPISDIYYK